MTTRTRRSWGWVAGTAATMAALVGGVVAMAAPTGAQSTGPTFTVEPTHDLVDGSQVTVELTGLGPYGYAEIAQCPAGADDLYEDCDTTDTVHAFGDTDGRASVGVRVDALLTVGEPGGPTPTMTDCRLPGACILAMASGSEQLTSSVPLHFRPDAEPAPPPTATVSPDGQLHDLQTVTVTAAGLVWSTDADVAQCAADPAELWADCSGETRIGHAPVDGELTVDLRLDALIYTDRHGVVDCRLPGSCVLAVTQDNLRSPARTAIVPLSFDPDAEFVPPTVTVTPDTDLVDGQTVTVEGRGFVTGDFLPVMVCPPPAGGDPGPVPPLENCKYTDAYAEPDADGSFTAEVQVPALVSAYPGDPDRVDCRRTDEPCQLVVGAGGASSPRAGRAPLHFLPDGPLVPGPEIEVEPSTGVADGATVTVTGHDFVPVDDGVVQLCATGTPQCDHDTSVPLEPDDDGNISLEISVAATFPSGDEVVGCRAAPGCEIVAEQYGSGKRATAPLSFGPPDSGGDRRYLDPVFDSVDVTRDVVYRDTVDAAGNPVQLRLDIYEPAGDTADERPAVVWMGGGPSWFGDGSKADMAGYAEDFARRGYVAVALDYRGRPGLACCPASDAIAVTEALVDGYEDAAAGVEWLRDHADDHRIDPEAIVAGGSSAGGANAFSLANIAGQLPGDAGPGHGDQGGHDADSADDGGHDGDDDGGHGGHGDDEGSSLVAAALPISGVSLGRHDADEAPVLAFHGSNDLTAPLHLSEWTCERAEAVDVRCETYSYAGAGHRIAGTRRADIVRRSAEFVAEVVLEPLGYLPDRPGVTTSTTQHHTTTTHSHSTTTHGPGGTHGTGTTHGSGGTHGTAGGHGQGGSGSSGTGRSGRLARTGAEIATLIVVGLALTALGALLVIATRSRRRTTTPGERGDGARLVGGVRSVLGRRGGDGRRGPARWVTAGIVALLFAATTVPGSAASPGARDASRSIASPQTGGARDGAATEEPGHEAGDPGHEDPEHDPEDPGHGDPGFPEEWTPEQVAYAEALIADTEAALPRFANPAILPLLGYVWIFDGTEPDTYQHWISLNRISNGTMLDPDDPESLVFRMSDEGPVLEAAMYILPLGFTMANIPPDVAWLPDWHIHTNLCFDGSYRLVGLAVDGQCERGFLVIPPPMLHVWTVDTPCGRFAGVDEHGLQCHDHDDGHEPEP